VVCKFRLLQLPGNRGLEISKSKIASERTSRREIPHSAGRVGSISFVDPGFDELALQSFSLVIGCSAELESNYTLHEENVSRLRYQSGKKVVDRRIR
jgi:hypothetical protein